MPLLVEGRCGAKHTKENGRNACALFHRLVGNANFFHFLDPEFDIKGPVGPCVGLLDSDAGVLSHRVDKLNVRRNNIFYAFVQIIAMAIENLS